jgi:hypothetical protein
MLLVSSCSSHAPLGLSLAYADAASVGEMPPEVATDPQRACTREAQPLGGAATAFSAAYQ